MTTVENGGDIATVKIISVSDSIEEVFGKEGVFCVSLELDKVPDHRWSTAFSLGDDRAYPPDRAKPSLQIYGNQLCISFDYSELDQLQRFVDDAKEAVADTNEIVRRMNQGAADAKEQIEQMAQGKENKTKAIREALNNVRLDA